MLKSSVAWVDFAEQDRRRMAEVISLFGHRDTRDELGLGSVRDAFANLFFPGTSTLQTRARYFLFIPWTYRYFENHEVGSHRIERRLRNYEVGLIAALAETDQDGVIGIVSGASLQRFPSSIYWNGLGAWGSDAFSVLRTSTTDHWTISTGTEAAPGERRTQSLWWEALSRTGTPTSPSHHRRSLTKRAFV